MAPRNSVSVHVGAKDDASGPIDRIRDKFSDLQKQGAQGIIAGATAAASVMAFNMIGNAISGVTSFMAEGVRGAIEEEASINRLTKALETNVPAWDGQLGKIEETIEARQALGFADDAQRDSLALLVAATGDQTKALALNRTAMDLARLKGIDLATASQALIKVGAGQFRVLKELGIQLPKNSSATSALAAVQKIAAGQAEAYGETTAGSMEAAGIAIDNLKEEFGAVLLPIIKEGAQFLTTTAIPAFRDMAGSIGEVATAAAEAFDPISDLLDELNRPTNPSLVAPVGLAISLEGLKIAYANLRDEWKDPIDPGPFFEQLREHAEREAEDTGRVFGGSWGPSAGEAFGSSWGKLADKFEAAARALPGKIADGIQAARQAPITAFDSMLEAMEHSMSATAETAFLIGQLIDQRLADGLADADPIVRRRAEMARDSILDRLEELKPRAGTLTEEAWTGVAQMMDSKIPEVRRAGEALGRSIEEGVPTSADGRRWGSNLGAAYALGLSSAESAIKLSANRALQGARAVMIASSPPGPESPLHLIDVWGYRTGLAWADGLAEGIATAKGKLDSELGALSAGFRDWQDAFTSGGFEAGADAVRQEEARPKGGRYVEDSPGIWHWQADDAPAEARPMSSNGPSSIGSAAASGAATGVGGGGMPSISVQLNAPVLTPYGGFADDLARALWPAILKVAQENGYTL